MATKKLKKPEFPQGLYVSYDGYDDEKFLITSENINDTASYDGTRVGVYQLVKVVTVTSKTEVVVEE